MTWKRANGRLARRRLLQHGVAWTLMGNCSWAKFAGKEQDMMNDASIEEHSSPFDFDTTVERLTQAIQRAGLRLFATIDHASGARTVGLSMPPTTVLLYGHPKGGTPIMQAVPSAALELPLRVLVRQDSALRTVIAFQPITTLLARYGVEADLGGHLKPAQRLLVDALRE